MKRSTALALMLTVLALPLAVPALAESHEEAEAPPQPVIWVSFLKTTGQNQAMIEYIIEENTGLYGDLMAQGKVLEWGVAQPIVHPRGEAPYHVAEWVTFTDWAAMDGFVTGFMAKQGAMSPEERKANIERYMSMVVPGSHYDAVHQSIHAASDGERPTYLSLGFQKALPGKQQQLIELWQTAARPVFEQLMADGAIQGFGLFTQAVHGDHSWSLASWTTMSGLGGMDAVNKAFAAMSPETMGQFMEMVDWGSHWDEVLVVAHYENALGE